MSRRSIRRWNLPPFLRGVVSMFAWAAISLETIFWVIPIFVLFLVHRLFDPRLARAHFMAGCWGRSLVRLAPGCRVQVIGAQNLPKDRPVILMANHQSYVDVPVLFHIRHQFKWMADVELFRIPFFGWAMRMAGYVPIRRGDAKAGIRSLEQAKGWLSKGISIFIFPEGTRTHTGVFSRFQTGGFRLAVTTGTPIVPVVVVGTRQMLPRGTWMFHGGVRLQIHILPPVLPEGDHPRQIHRLAKQLRARMFEVYCRQLKEIYV